jgi:copper chaperone CopZ
MKEVRMKRILEIKGMTCEHCAKKVYKIISGFDGVSDVSVELQRMEATFGCDPDKTDAEDVVKAINDFGYTAKEK